MLEYVGQLNIFRLMNMANITLMLPCVLHSPRPFIHMLAAEEAAMQREALRSSLYNTRVRCAGRDVGGKRTYPSEKYQVTKLWALEMPIFSRCNTNAQTFCVMQCLQGQGSTTRSWTGQATDKLRIKVTR